jgi:putative redox protein
MNISICPSLKLQFTNILIKNQVELLISESYNMKISMKHKENMKISAENSLGHSFDFDTASEHGGDDSAPTPMEMLLGSLGACSFMDIISILKKKRKTINGFEIDVDGERAGTHPKVFIKAHLIYTLISPNTELSEFERAVNLSHEKYCSVSAMFKRSGCEVTCSCKVIDG